MVKVSTVICDKFDYNTGNGILHVEKYSDGRFSMYGYLLITESNMGVLIVEHPFSMQICTAVATPRYNNYPDLITSVTANSSSVRIDLTKNGKGTPEMDNEVNIIVVGRWK